MNTRRLGTLILLIAATLLYCWAQVWTAFHSINSNDFKHIYLGMKALLDGISPYSFNALHHQAALQGYRQISLNPYVYLPFTGHAMAFLAPLRLEQAIVAWFLLNHLFAAASIWMISALWPDKRTLAVALLILASAVSFPFFRTLTAGQLNMALLFLICLARFFLTRTRPAAAGCILAFAALYKLMPGIYGLYLLLQRRFRALAWMALGGIAMLALSTIAAGTQTTLEFFPVLQQMGYGKSTWPAVYSFWDDPPNQSLNSFFSHIFARGDATMPWVILGQGAANSATWIAVTILLIAYVITVGQNPHPRQPGVTMSDDLAYSATLLLGLLIPSLMWDHYLVMTILPVAALLKFTTSQRRWISTLLVVICYILISTPWPFDYPNFRHGPGILLMSMKLWPTILLFGLSLCFVKKARTISAPTLIDKRADPPVNLTTQESQADV